MKAMNIMTQVRAHAVAYDPYLKVQNLIDQLSWTDDKIFYIEYQKGEYANVYSCASTIRQALKRMHKDHWFEVHVKNEKVWLIKTM